MVNTRSIKWFPWFIGKGFLDDRITFNPTKEGHFCVILAINDHNDGTCSVEILNATGKRIWLGRVYEWFGEHEFF